MSVIIDLTIFPMDKEGNSLSPYVARVVEIIKDSGLPFELGPMGTSIEGEWEEVMGVIDLCYHELEKDSDRIYLTLKADSKKHRKNGIISKVRSVKELMK